MTYLIVLLAGIVIGAVLFALFARKAIAEVRKTIAASEAWLKGIAGDLEDRVVALEEELKKLAGKL